MERQKLLGIATKKLKSFVVEAVLRIDNRAEIAASLRERHRSIDGVALAARLRAVKLIVPTQCEPAACNSVQDVRAGRDSLDLEIFVRPQFDLVFKAQCLIDVGREHPCTRLGLFLCRHEILRSTGEVDNQDDEQNDDEKAHESVSHCHLPSLRHCKAV